MLLLGGFALLAASAHPGAPTAVLVLGSSASAAGSLQGRLIEVVQADHRLSIVPEEALVAALWPGGAPPDMAERAGFGNDPLLTQLSRARRKYYAGDPTLERDLEGIESSANDGTPEAVHALVTVLFWRVALALDHDNQVGARLNAIRALSLEPDRDVDVKLFPPGVRDAVEAARAAMKGQPKVRLDVQTWPPDATTLLDGRASATGKASFAGLDAGAHWLRVSAPGFRTVFRSIDVTEAVSLSVSLAPRLPPHLEELAGEHPDLDLLAARLGVDVLVLGQADSRWAMVWSRGDPALGGRLCTAGESGDLEGCVRERLAGALPEGKSPSPLSTRLGLLLAQRVYGLTSPGASYQAAFSGAGLGGEVRWEQGRASVEFQGELTRYDLSEVSVTAPDGNVSHVPGGIYTHARLLAGWAPAHLVELSRGLRLRAGLAFERLDSRDALDGAGNPLGLFPGWHRESFLLGVGWRLSRRSMTLEVDAELAPVSELTESPAGTSGSQSLSGTAGGSASLIWAPPGARGRFRLVGGVAVAASGTSFTGYARAPLSPPANQATVFTGQGSLFFGLERHF